MKTFFRIALLTFLSTALFADGLNDLNGVVAGELKVPFYNNDRLQAMVFAQNAEYRDQLLFGKEVIINLVSKNADPDKVANDNKLQIYPLESTLFKVACFWLQSTGRLERSERYLSSDAVIWTAAAVIDRIARTASGNVEVKMRSPLVDLDGLGFNADFQKKQIRVNKEVKLVLRMTNSDPREFREVKNVPLNPLDYRRMNGRGDMLHLDLAENRIMLIGKVVLEDAQVKIGCDRLTVIMGGEKNKSSDDLELGAAGVQAIYADGHVRIQKLKKGVIPQDPQELLCDHLVYDVAKDRIALTNDKGKPRINFGNQSFIEGNRMIFFRKNQQAIFPDDCFLQSFEPQEGLRTVSCDYGNLRLHEGICDLLGNVKMNAAEGKLRCDSMRVFLKKKKQVPKSKKSKKFVDDQTLIGDMKMDAEEIERIACKGNVQLERLEKGKLSTLNADTANMEYRKKLIRFDKNVSAFIDSGKGKRSMLNAESAFMDYMKGFIVFEKNVKIHSDSGNLACNRLEIQLSNEAAKRELRTATATGNVKIERIDKDGKMVLTAPKGFFDYARNRIDFSDKVSARKGKSTLDCDKLELFLADQKDTKSENSGIPGLMETGGHGKTLEHAVLTGKVHLADGGNTLDTDKCLLFFGPALPGADKKPGFFQSGSLRLLRIVCDGNLIAKSPTEKQQDSASQKNFWSKTSGGRTVKAQHSVTDLLRHTSLFTGKVSLCNQENQLDCDKLELFATPLAAGQKLTAKKAPSIDDDPFAIQAENSVPQIIVFNGNMQLKKVISTGNVVFKHKDAEKLPQTLFCDKATFDGDEMIVRCVSRPPKRPILKAEGLTQTAEQYRILLIEERVEAIGATETL